MGVIGLYSAITGKYKDRVTRPVSIRRMAQEFRAANGLKAEEEVVLVVDAMCLTQTIYESLDWICGGQWAEFEDGLQRFVKAFEQIGVKLVLIFDGSFDGSK